MLTDLFRLQIDLLSARGELAASVATNWILNKAAPSGRGNQPVITFPGFLASDDTLLRLNRFLNRHGFAAQSWGVGRNLGPRGMSWTQLLDILVRDVGTTIRRLADEHSAPVSLVGQSLGGVYARELALRMPDVIDRVIMLGSPTFHPYNTANFNRVIALFGYWLHRQSHAEMAGRSGLLHWDADEPPLPCVSIHSPADGIVDEVSAVIPQYVVARSVSSAPRENLRVLSSHVGMAVNPAVLLAVADRLAQARDAWEDFNPYRYYPSSLHWAVSLLYPAPDAASEAFDIAALVESR